MMKIILLLISINVWAFEEATLIREGITDLSIVSGVGLGGVILGASTLPFTKHPSHHFKNILVGGSLGMIVGVFVVAWGQANKSKSRYYEQTSTYFLPISVALGPKKALIYTYRF